MNKTKIGGILEIVSGVFGLLYTFTCLAVAFLGGFFSSGELSYLSDFYPIIVALMFLFFAFSLLALIGGIFALMKRQFGLALTGAIFSIVMFFFCGIPAFILIIMAKPEFNEARITA
jgi:hypothetical protein